jgi:hypothetical protein
MTGRRILKFVIQPGVTGIATADAPRFRAVGNQNGEVVVWAEATPGSGVQTLLGSLMTGEEPPPDGEYIGTTQLTTEVGLIVVHVYRQVRP